TRYSPTSPSRPTTPPSWARRSKTCSVVCGAPAFRHPPRSSPEVCRRMSTTAAASTRRLLELCVAYFVFYVMTGVLVKLYTGMPDAPLYHRDITYLANNTIGGAVFALAIVVAMRWFRLHSNRPVQVGPFKVPSELAYIIPSGICTAVVIPTTTLMYTLPISVLVAMVIMRGSVIVISRVVDELQIRQGILQKRVYHEENLAVMFALLAVATNVLLVPVVAFLDGR